MFYLRLCLMLIWFLLCCALAFLWVPFRWGTLNLNHDIAKSIAWGLLKITSIEVEVLGEENLYRYQPCIYVSNHQSGFDIATFGSIYPKKTIAIGKKEVLWIPFFGLLFAAAGNVMIDRAKRAKAIASLSHAVTVMRQKMASVWIFPEGTRNSSGVGLLQFKKGAFFMAIEAGAPIVPMVSSSLSPLVNWRERKIRSGKIRLQILPAIETSGMKSTDIDLLLNNVRQKMLEALRGLSTELY